MADKVKEILSKPIEYANEVVKLADQASSFRQECIEIKAKTRKLLDLLKDAVCKSNNLYERPTRRIIDETEQVLDKTLTLILKCRANGLRRIFTIIPQAAFRKISQQLENSIGDVTWLLSVSSKGGDDEYLGLPPIAANEPILCLIWEQIAILASGSWEEKSDAAASLVSLARDNDRYGNLIIEEGGVPPLLKLAKEGRLEGQENAARAIGLLGKDPESVEQIVNSGACQVFAKILKEGHMKVQLVVAWAVSELAAHHPKCQDHFAQNNTIRLLVSHLAFETIQEHSKYAIVSKHQSMSIHTVVMANSNTKTGGGDERADGEDSKRFQGQIKHPTNNESMSQMHNVVTNTIAKNPSLFQSQGVDDSNSNKGHKPPAHKLGKNNQNQNPNQHHGNERHHHVGLPGNSIKRREFEDPETKAQMKSMAARALRFLCAGNVNICRSITESRALLCFAVLLEKGEEDVKYNSAMALMEITSVAERDTALRRSAFKPTSPPAKAVVDQFLRIIEKADSELLIPSIRSIGNLARTFRATETRFIGPLVRLLDDREPEIMSEAAIALCKFTCPDNYLHVIHCKSIIDLEGPKQLVPLTYFGEQMVQIPCFILLCYLALHVPESRAWGQSDVLVLFEWSMKAGNLKLDKELEELLYEAKKTLEMYQSRKSKGV